MSTTSYQDLERGEDRHEGRQDSPGGMTSVNVGETERIASLVAGAALTLMGLRRGSLGGLAIAGLGGMLAYRGVKGHCGLYQKLGLNTAKPAEPNQYFNHGIHVEVSATIDRTASELYTFWRNFENLPRFMDHLQSVKVIDEKRSTWVARGPAGTSVKWDAEIINDVPNETIAWRSLGGAQVDNAGSVRFVEGPSGRGTEVHVVLDYIPPGRTLGKWVAKLFGEDPQTQIETDLRRFKMLMETGEVASTQGQPRGTCSSGD
jgi:uncharacterized membrane protein